MKSDTRSRVVFLLDVDNTLLDNDSVTADLKKHLVDNFGDARADSARVVLLVIYWAVCGVAITSASDRSA